MARMNLDSQSQCKDRKSSRPWFLSLLAGLILQLFLAPALRAQTVSTNFSFNDILVAPVRVHLLSAKNLTALHTTLNEKDVARIFQKANRVWSAAGVQFYVESIVREE